MSKFTSRKAVTVCLRDEAGNEFAQADLRGGSWVAPDEDQAGAMRRQIPALAEFGIREIADDDEPDVPRRRRGRHIAGPVSTSKLAEKPAE